MAKFNPPSTTITLIIICLVHQIANASIIPPSNQSPQGSTTSGGDDNATPYDETTNNKGPSQPWTSGGAHPLRGGSNIATTKASAAKDDDTNYNVNEEETMEMAHHGRFFAVNSMASVRSTTTTGSTTPTSDNNNVPAPSLATTTTTTTKKKKRIRRIMDYESIALALRLTCEVNRRLDCAIAGGNCTPQSKPFGWTKHDPTTGRSVLDSRTYGDNRNPQQHPSEQYQQRQPTPPSSTLVHVHPSQAWQRPIRERTEAPFYDPRGPRSTTLFDTPHRQRTQPLTDHVKQIADSLAYGPIIPALALLLLDRASSVETQRGNDGVGLLEKTCPYLTPRTVHKLYLTAVLLANRMVRGELPSHLYQQPHATAGMLFQDEYTQYYAELLTRGGIEITPYELGEMMEWMFHSLGMDGLNVSQAEVDRLLASWKSLFIWESEGEEERDGRQGDGAISMGHDHDAAFVRGDASWKSQEVSRGHDNKSNNQEIGGMEGAQNYGRQHEDHILKQG